MWQYWMNNVVKYVPFDMFFGHKMHISLCNIMQITIEWRNVIYIQKQQQYKLMGHSLEWRKIGTDDAKLAFKNV